MFYTVLEIQVALDGSKACIPTIYTEWNDALAKFFTICHAATASEIPYHAAIILADGGQVVKTEIFDRRVVE